MGRLEDVHAQVDQGAAALEVLAAEDAPARDPAAAQRLAADVEHLAELPGLHLVVEHLAARLEAVLEADDELLARPPRGLDHLRRLAGGHRHRLLDQHVLAGVQRRDRVLGVQAVGRADADRVDLGHVAEHLVVVGVRPLDVVLVLDLGQGLFVHIRDGDDLDAGDALQVLHLVQRDPAGADERNPEGLGRGGRGRLGHRTRSQFGHDARAIPDDVPAPPAAATGDPHGYLYHRTGYRQSRNCAGK
jgi:hypothetical protein